MDPRSKVAREGGFTLLEMLVAMGLFSILMVVFMAGVTQMTHNSIRVENTSNDSTDAAKAFNLLDKQVRYADSVNQPTEVGSDWYVEFETKAQPSGVQPQCTQWRLVHSTQRMEFRTWPDVDAAVPTAWRTAASFVVNDPTSAQPFTVQKADSTYLHQQLTADLRVQRGKSPASQMSATFVARNSDITAQTNGAGGDYVPVCTQVGQP